MKKEERVFHISESVLKQAILNIHGTAIESIKAVLSAIGASTNDDFAEKIIEKIIRNNEENKDA